MSDYAIAVPTYRRPERCGRTVRNLLDRGFPADAIHVFLSDAAERAAYAAELPAAVHVIDGRPGIAGNRNAITETFDHEQRILSVDDDITTLKQLTTGGRLAPVTDWVEFVDAAWDNGGRLWGINPTGNPFYMRPRVRHGLVFCIGFFHGCVNDHELPSLTAESKEDYERSILYFEKYGSVTRFDWVTANNAYGRTEGGLGRDREERNRAAAASLTARWPQYARYKPGTDTEITLRVRHG